MDTAMKNCIVISGVNFSEGGPLTIMRECLEECLTLIPHGWRIVALVHDERLFDISGIEFISFPKAKRSWSKRLYYEYVVFHRLSKRLQATVWLSLHDITPRVIAERRAVYCHNPSPFYSPSIADFWFDPKFFLFTLFYKHLYRINIHTNQFVIVQQDWIRDAFKRMYSVSDVVVAHPIPPAPTTDIQPRIYSSPTIFFYPALPRTFKNFETLCRAAIDLARKTPKPFEVRITIDGNENRYAKWLKSIYGRYPYIKFIGRQSKEEMSEQYSRADAVVFPSRLETWGLPITEAKQRGKRLIVADLPYAHETSGNHADVVFFDPNDHIALSLHMKAIVCGEVRPTLEHHWPPPKSPFAENWHELIRMLTQ